MALLKTHKQFETMVKKMGKAGMMKGGDAQVAKQMGRNPKQAMTNLNKAIDPRMLQQMGGAENVMKMMQSMGGAGGGEGGGMGGLGDMMKMMGGGGGR
jgi:signal recognition particle subunit SRP54